MLIRSSIHMNKGRKVKFLSGRLFPLLVVVFILQILLVHNSVAAEKTIGVIMAGKIPYYENIHKSFINELNRSGLITSENISIVVQKPAPAITAWENAVRKLIVIESAVIVSYGAPVTLTALDKTSKIPVIYAGVYDPKALGINQKNASGISSKVPVAGLMKNFKEIANFSKLGVIYNDAEKDTVLQANEVRKLEGKFGYKTTLFNIRKKGDEAKIKNIDSLYLTTSCAGMYCVNNIISIARKAKIPTATTIGGGEERGVILTIAADPAEQGTKAAQMAIKVIQGAKPSSLPMQKPKKISMIVNLGEAKDMGLKIPLSILTTATRVIQ